MPVKNKSHYYIVLVYPHIHSSTAEVYEMVNVKKALTNKGNINNIIKYFNHNKSINQWGKYLVNDLEDVVFPRCSVIQSISTRMHEAGADAVLMSGSGSAVFGLSSTQEKAFIIKRRLLRLIDKKKISIWIVQPCRGMVRMKTSASRNC